MLGPCRSFCRAHLAKAPIIRGCGTPLEFALLGFEVALALE